MSGMPFIDSSGPLAEDGHNARPALEVTITGLHTKLAEARRAAGSARADAGRMRRERDEARADARRLRDALISLSADAGAGSGLAERVHRTVYGENYLEPKR